MSGEYWLSSGRSEAPAKYPVAFRAGVFAFTGFLVLVQSNYKPHSTTI